MRPRSLRRSVAVAAALALSTAGAVAALTSPSLAAAQGCTVAYSVTNQWPGGFGGTVAVTNLGDPVATWKLEFDFPVEGQAVTQLWNGIVTQSGRHVTVTNAGWNGPLGTNATATPGFNGAWTTANPAPTAFTLNGVPCNGATPTPGPTPTASPSPSPTASPSPSPSPTASPGPNPGHVDNAFAGATGYVNPDWRAKALAEPGGSRIANTPTGVWLDRIAAIAGTPNAMGLRAHLEAALTQDAANGATPLTIEFVVYNLPNRDCSALASNGELLIAQNGLHRYKTEYVDPIAAILAEPRYRNLRIVTVIEIDSLPNLITNLNVPACQEAQSSGAYVQGVRYALDKLHAIGNVYTYVDAAHHGWLGWDTNFGPAANLFASTVAGTAAGFASVDGFITNTANYSALTEPHFSITTTVNGATVRQSTWVDWNYHVDEQSYATAFRAKLVSVGFQPGIGMLIDTSRNGWGGAARPAGPSTSTVLDTFVNDSRTDRRIHAGNWCNQSGAGLGERPRANPAPGIDAYVWIKPPGESDGSSTAIPNNEGKGFDRMCDPTYTGNERNGHSMSGALPDSPLAGAWFSAQFQQLMANAYPAL